MNSPLGSFLSPPGFIGPQGLRALAREGSVMLEGAAHLRHMRQKKRAHGSRPYAGSHRQGGTVPVLLIPGFMAGDWSLSRMAAGLRLEGFRTYKSLISVNAGCTREALDKLERRIEEISLRRDRKVLIVGHSLGGMLARGLAARRPDLVAGIVTMGSPVLAPGAVHKVLAWDAEVLGRLNKAGLSSMMSSDCMSGPCAKAAFEEMQSPVAEEVGYTAIFSHRDGIVSPASCIDPAADQHIEVKVSHVGMALDPVTFEHVADALRSMEPSASAAVVTPATASADPSNVADLPRLANT